jgi:cytochrome o ubiquinol oxidase operon protein cyoD
MSSNAHTHDHGHDHGHGHDDHGHGQEASHSTLKGYMVGFVLSVILTVIPFWLVMAKVFSDPVVTVAVVMILGAIQIIVHMIYFLHLDTKSEGGWNIMAMIFTIVLVVICLSGSMWVMYHLNANMMPMSPDMMRNLP